MPRFIANHVPRPTLGKTTVGLLVASFIVLADNRLFWRSLIARLGLGSAEHWIFLLILGVALVLTLNLLFSLLAFKPTFKPFLVFMLLTAAAIGYFSDNFSIAIDRPMIHNLLETDLAEASELMSWPLLRHFLLFGLLPASLVIVTPVRHLSRRREFATRAGVVLGSLALLLILTIAGYRQIVLFGRENRDLQIYFNPVYPLYSLQKVVKKTYFARTKEPLRTVAPDAAKTGSGPRSVVVLALGETARAQAFSLNGYGRDTNPQLAAREIVNFPDVQSCGTSTAESVPCLFSVLKHENFSRYKAGRQENLLDILQRAGVEVLWRDNNSGSKGVADRVPFEDLSRQKDPDLCSSGNCFDEILLRDLDKRMAESSEDMLIVLHMKGSHGPSYYKRTPENFKLFSPECSMDNIQDCSRDSIVNAYDNTIVYTDNVLAKLIDLLESQNFATAMLYVSDHGESLGENGLYLHGLPYAVAPDEQTHVPMIFWASDSFTKQKRFNMVSLNSRRGFQYSHDFIFHSILGLFGINTKIYQPYLDIFATCRNFKPHENLAGANAAHK